MGIDRNSLCYCGSGKKVKKCHGFNNDSVFARLDLTLTKMSKNIEKNADFKNLKCKKGCSECCYQVFHISTAEFYWIAYNIINEHGLDKFKESVQKGVLAWDSFQYEHPEEAKLLSSNLDGLSVSDSYMKIIEDFDKNSPDFHNLPCPFLDESQGCCLVYNYRPSVCRHFGVSYIDKPTAKDTSTIAFCSKTMDDTDYIQYQADLTNMLEELMDIDVFYSSKYKVQGVNRQYPIFYFCKIANKNYDNVLSKINEFKNLSKDEYSNIRMGRALRK